MSPFPPKLRFAPLVLVLVVTLRALTLGLITDDYAFRALLHAKAPYGRPAYDLFRFASGDSAEIAQSIQTGHLPWWTAPDLRIHFMRPLTGLLFAADDALFGSHAWLDHVHSIAWYLALVAAVGMLYRRLFHDGPAAALAMLVFAWSQAHAYSYAWLAARHVLVGALPAVIALWAHVRFQDDGWRPGRWIAPVALVIALSGSEVALAGVVYWIAFDLLGHRSRPWRARFTACAPALAIAIAYLVLYRILGGGARSSGGYHDPSSDPVGFAQVALTRVPILLGDALLGVPAELSLLASPDRLAVVGLIAIAIASMGYALCRNRISVPERDALHWLLPGALAATLLGATGFPSGRILVLPDVGFAALIGILIARGFEMGKRRGMRTALAFVLVAVHLAFAPFASWRTIVKLGRRGRASEAIAQRLADLTPATGRVFLIASDPQVFLYPRGILADTQPGVLRCESVLSAARAGHRITRIDERALTIEPIERPLLDGSFDTLFRAPDRPFAVDDAVRQCGATIRIAEVRDGLPTRLLVTFDRPLDAPDLAIVVWRNHRLERLDVLPVGRAIDVTWSAGPTGL